MKTFIRKKDIPKDFTGVCRVFERSETRWYVNGKAHRKNAPAVINDNGMQQWWLNGQRHRLNGPAVYGRQYKGGKSLWSDEYRVHGKLYKKQDYNELLLVKANRVLDMIKGILLL